MEQIDQYDHAFEQESILISQTYKYTKNIPAPFAAIVKETRKSRRNSVRIDGSNLVLAMFLIYPSRYHSLNLDVNDISDKREQDD